MKHIKTLTFSALVLTLLISVGTPASAEVETEATDSVNVEAQSTLQMKRDAEERRMEIKQEIDQKRAEIETMRKDQKDAMEARKMEVKEDIKQKIEERKTKLQENTKRRIEKQAKMIISRLGATIERITKLADRIESRINKAEENGVDVSKSKEFLATARAEITSAHNIQVELSASLTLALESDTPKETFNSEFRSKIEEIKTHLKNAHRALAGAVSNLKAGLGLEKKLEAQASTTVESAQ